MNEFVRNLEAELGKGRRPVLQLDQEEAEDEENARPVRATDETPEGPPDTNNDAEEERYEPTELEVPAPENGSGRRVCTQRRRQGGASRAYRARGRHCVSVLRLNVHGHLLHVRPTDH